MSISTVHGGAVRRGRRARRARRARRLGWAQLQRRRRAGRRRRRRRLRASTAQKRQEDTQPARMETSTSGRKRERERERERESGSRGPCERLPAASLGFWVAFGWGGGARGQWACSIREPQGRLAGCSGAPRRGLGHRSGALVGRAEAEEDGLGRRGAAWALWMREHSPPPEARGRDIAEPATHDRAEVLREPLVACCAHVVAGRAVPRSRAFGNISDVSATAGVTGCKLSGDSRLYMHLRAGSLTARQCHGWRRRWLRA